MVTTRRLTPCLWFVGIAEDAAKYYVETSENSKITAAAMATPERKFKRSILPHCDARTTRRSRSHTINHEGST